MKLTIKQNVLAKAISQGAVSAISDAAQLDTSNLSAIIQSVKITVDKQFVVESSTNLMAVKYAIDATEENGIDVKETGCVLIPAKEFSDWVKVQGDESAISMVFSKLAVPEIINPMDDLGSGKDTDKFSIKKIGSMKFVSKDSTKTSGKWELDCYDPTPVKSINFSKKGNKHFEIKTEDLVTSLGKVKFAALDRDVDHVLDHISIQTYEDNLYFASTDTKRCALYQVPIVGKVENQDPLLVPAKLLDQVCKISSKDNIISLSYNEEIGRIFLSQPNLDIRIVSAEKDNISKFPSITMLLPKPYKELANISKGALYKILISAALVNRSTALFNFKKDDNDVSIKAISEEGKYKPSISKAKANKITSDIQGVWGVTHLIEVIKTIKDDMITLHIPSNKKSLKITSSNDGNFQYYAMAINSSVYVEE